jgi:hypothetical protein
VPNNNSFPSIYDAVWATIVGAGVSEPSFMIRTILLEDGRFLGEKYRFDQGYAVWLAGPRVIEVYDDSGKLLRSAPAETTDAKGVA